MLFCFVGILEKYFADFLGKHMAAYKFGHAYFTGNVGSGSETVDSEKIQTGV